MVLQLGVYQVDSTQNKVLKNGRPVNWGGKASHLFSLLLQQAPNTIAKEEIFAEVWKGRVVTENTLYKTISKLRQELNPQEIEIESVFGEGYRIVAPQKAVEVNTAEAVRKSAGKHKLLVMVLLLLSLSALGMYVYQKHSLFKVMNELNQVLAVTKQAFISQINRRNELGELLSLRFTLKTEDSWEKRFFQLYDDMNEQERFLCKQSRAYTEGPIFENNQKALQIILAHPRIIDEIPLAQELVNHLTIWLNKYDRVFVGAERMCLLYVGVEDGAKYPSGFDGQLQAWIDQNQ